MKSNPNIRYQRGEVSLALLDILSCALAAMLIVFIIFSLFSRVGTASTIKSPNLQVSEIIALELEKTDDFPVRMYQLSLSGCTIEPLDHMQRERLTLSLIKDSLYTVLVTKSGAEIPLNCGPVGTAIFKPIRAPETSIGKYLLGRKRGMRYRASGWGSF